MNGQRSRQAVAISVAIAMVAAPVLAQAQNAPGPALQPVPGTAFAGDPPARVGRVALLSGTVSYHLAGATQWDVASLNLPVTTGSAFWTEPGAKAELDVTGTRLEMDQSTELDMVQLDDSAFVTSLPQGEAYVQVRGLLPNGSVVVQTPRGQVSLTKDGQYDIAAGNSGDPTIVTVVDGAATIAGTGALVQVGPNQAATITGDGQATPFSASLGAAQRDAFLSAALAAHQPVRPHTVQIPADVDRMTGGYVLDEYGDWASTPQYGAIWYPPDDQGYVPYRHGHWGYVAPWGWTWIDDAPWGFAPSHYGRWVEVQDRWGWLPGGGPLQPGYQAPAYPVYAPAVVAFLAGAAVGALAANALERGSVGWVPLGPHEPYYPPYRASAAYVRNLNVAHVSNVNAVVTTYNTVINRGPAGRGAFNQGPQFGAGPLADRAAATSIPAAAMARSQSVAGLARPVPAAALAGTSRLMTRPPITPTSSTLGVTPGVAREYHIQAPVARQPAPGPALRPAAAAVLAPPRPGVMAPRPAAPTGLPALRPAGGPQNERPNGGAPGPAIGPRQPVAPSAAPRPEAARPNVIRPEPPAAAREPQPATRPAPVARPETRVAEPPHVEQPARPSPPRAAPPPRAEPRPEARPEPRPEPRPEARPAARPAPAAARPHEEEKRQ
jgi:hypothetical protein